MAFAVPRKIKAAARVARSADRSKVQVDCVVLSAQSAQPLLPVRIFVGTEDAQFRAERVFVWSVLRHRNPDRRYEIYLMRNLPGFDRRGWLTGFTNYRFAVPELAGGRGKAIYNDVDQIYLADPGELFDQHIGDSGFLSIDPSDTSVMLIDCARMVSVWNTQEARRRRRKFLEEAAGQQARGWGRLDAGWNARDEEYDPLSSKLLHFTTIHTQPWCPFPEQYVYQRNPVADLWLEYEAAADVAAFEIFSRGNPSTAWAELRGDRGVMNAGVLRLLLEHADGLNPGGTVTVVSGPPSLPAVAGQSGERRTGVPGRAVRACSFEDLASARSATDTDTLLFGTTLDSIPPPDLPWVLSELFDATQGVLLLGIAGDATDRRRILATLERISHRFAPVHWRLYECTARTVRMRRSGGAVLTRDGPRVWILSDGKPGHDTQSLGLAEALGWGFEFHALRFGPLSRLQYRLLGLLGQVGANRLGVSGVARLAPPWPDLVITTGWAAGPVARWIARKSCGATRTLMLGRRGGRIANAFDIVVSARYHRLPFAPNRIETVAPLNRLSDDTLAKAGASTRALFDQLEAPILVALVGGASRRYPFGATDARQLAEALLRLKRQRGGSLFVVTSRRTGDEATRQLIETIGDQGIVDIWHRDRPDNPYPGCLAHADVTIVTGESESMLAEAAATGKPLLIHPAPVVPDTAWHRLVDAVDRRAHARPLNRRGSVRPQQGLEYLCARLLQRGIVQPRRNLQRLYTDLVERNIAGYLSEAEAPSAVAPLREAAPVADRVKDMLDIWSPPSTTHAGITERLARRPDAA